MIEFAFYALAGAISGVLAGLFGIGGGLVIVPVLLIMFELKGFNPEFMVHMVVATSLAAIVLNGISAAWSQNKRGAVAWRRYKLVPLLVIGAITGAILADSLSGYAMRIVLVVFLIVMAIYMLAKPRELDQRHKPSGWLVQLASLAVGNFSALVGIAGGTFLVPLLHALGHPMRVAVGTSSALGVPMVLVAAISHMITGFNHPDLPKWSVGYVYLPAFLAIALISPWAAKIGVKLAHSIDQNKLRVAFSLFLFAVALQVGWKLYTQL